MVSANDMTKNLDTNYFMQISYELYSNKFTDNLTEKEQQDITRFMTYLVSVPSQLNLEFGEFLYKGIHLPLVIASILFSAMNNIKKFDINPKYQILKYETKYSPKSLNLLKTICDLYDIKIIEKKGILGKEKVKFVFPIGFRDRIINESLSLPKETKTLGNSQSDSYDDFVDWWSNCDEDEISKNKTLFEAYQIMWFYNEVCNGGFDQFWDFAEDSEWDLQQIQKSFKKILPANLYSLFDEALKAHLNGENCEKFNREFDYDTIENDVLPKLAQKVMKIVNQKKT